MPYLSETQLREAATFGVFNTAAATFLKSAPQQASVSIFLCHSHKDRELAIGLKYLLASAGITLYVDWLDKEMPAVPDRRTAENIKQRIHSSVCFLLLATQNAMISRWVPWEVGVADDKKPIHNIVVIPVADPTGKFYGNEYLQLYTRLEVGADGRMAVFEPGKTSGEYMDAWLRGRR